MTLRQAGRWLNMAGSRSVLLWQTTTWSKFLRSRCQTLNEPRMILHNDLSCLTYCQYFRWRILSLCFLLACDLLTSSGHGWWKQLPLCEKPIKREISVTFTKLNKLFFFSSQISPASGLVSILKKRGASVDDTAVSASSEIQAVRTPAKRRVRFRVPDDGYEHG